MMKKSPIQAATLFRKSSLLAFFAVTLGLSVSLQGRVKPMASNPDVTTEKGRALVLAQKKVQVLNLGPTGLKGWLYNKGGDTSVSRQILITTVDENSPGSATGMAVNDVILGVSGDGSTPRDFKADARKTFGLAIGEAEARSRPELKVKCWRSGHTKTLTLRLKALGAYSATAPWNCAKSKKILEAAVAHTLANEDAGRYSSNALALMAVRDVSLAGSSDSDRKTKAAAWAKEAILDQKLIDQLMNDWVDDNPGLVTWPYGHKLVVLCEYYLQTKDASVMPSIKALARGIGNGMSTFGTLGHKWTKPSRVDGSLNGSYNWGYGTVNQTGLVCFLGITLAKECFTLEGKNYSDLPMNRGIAAAAKTFAGYANVGGTIPYGEHDPGLNNFDNNGKNSLAAIAMSRVKGYEDQAKTFAYKSTAAAREFGRGHTGSWFSKFWIPLGANLVGEAAAQAQFNDIKWRLDFARRHDGGFAFNDIHQGNNGAVTHWRDFWANTHAIVTYAMPYEKLSIGTNRHVSPLSASEVAAAAFASTYDASTRKKEELLEDLDHDLVPVGYAAAKEMGTRTDDHAYFLKKLHAKVPNDAEPENGRMMGCFALSQIAGNGGKKSETSAALMAALLDHRNMRIRYGATYGLRYLPQDAKMTVATEILKALVSTAKEFDRDHLDPEDPMQFVHGQLSYLAFGPGRSSGPLGVLNGDKIYTEKVDPALYRPAIQAAGKTAMGRARGSMKDTYKNLNQEDFEYLCPNIVWNVENFPPLDRMFGGAAGMSGLETLQDRHIAEGVGLAKFFLWDLQSHKALPVFEKYAGSCDLVLPDQGITEYLQAILATRKKSGRKSKPGYQDPYQLVIDAIAADKDPTPLKSLKSLSLTVDRSTTNKATALHVTSADLMGLKDVAYTWSLQNGPSGGTAKFVTKDTSSGVFDTVVHTNGKPGVYTLKLKMSDTRGFAETGNLPSFANGYSEVTQTIKITVKK